MSVKGNFQEYLTRISEGARGASEKRFEHAPTKNGVAVPVETYVIADRPVCTQDGFD